MANPLYFIKKKKHKKILVLHFISVHNFLLTMYFVIALLTVLSVWEWYLLLFIVYRLWDQVTTNPLSHLDYSWRVQMTLLNNLLYFLYFYACLELNLGYCLYQSAHWFSEVILLNVNHEYLDIYPTVATATTYRVIPPSIWTNIFWNSC